MCDWAPFMIPSPARKMLSRRRRGPSARGEALVTGVSRRHHAASRAPIPSAGRSHGHPAVRPTTDRTGASAMDRGRPATRSRKGFRSLTAPRACCSTSTTHSNGFRRGSGSCADGSNGPRLYHYALIDTAYQTPPTSSFRPARPSGCRYAVDVTRRRKTPQDCTPARAVAYLAVASAVTALHRRREPGHRRETGAAPQERATTLASRPAAGDGAGRGGPGHSAAAATDGEAARRPRDVTATHDQTQDCYATEH
jgi:hypothetical protein